MDEAMDPDRLQSFIDFDIATIVQGIGGMKVETTDRTRICTFCHRFKTRNL